MRKKPLQEAVLKAMTHLAGFRANQNSARGYANHHQRRAHEVAQGATATLSLLDEEVTDGESEYRRAISPFGAKIPRRVWSARNCVRHCNAHWTRFRLPRGKSFFFATCKIQHGGNRKILGISVVAVKSRLLRARMQIRDALAPGIDGAWSLGETKWRKIRPW